MESEARSSVTITLFPVLVPDSVSDSALLAVSVSVSVSDPASVTVSSSRRHHQDVGRHHPIQAKGLYDLVRPFPSIRV